MLFGSSQGHPRLPSGLVSSGSTILDRLDRLPPWRFTGTLYVVRWLVIVPVAFIMDRAFTGGKISGANLGVMFWFGVLIVAPVFETLVECTLPYWIMRKLRLVPHDTRPWGFILTAAVMMILLHSSAWPAAIIPSFVTGAFLGYTYGHFAPSGFRQAFLHTTIFHACINLVGGILIAAG
jgi:hypothetical protein